MVSNDVIYIITILNVNNYLSTLNQSLQLKHDYHKKWLNVYCISLLNVPMWNLQIDDDLHKDKSLTSQHV